MSRIPPDQRPSARQIAAQASGGNPWECRVCGCKDWRVRDSRYNGDGPRKRERACRHCGEPLTTQEIPVPEGFKIKVVPEEEEEECAA